MERERNKQPSHCLREFSSPMLMINQLKKQNSREERLVQINPEPEGATTERPWASGGLVLQSKIN